MIYFVVDEYEETKESFQSQEEDLNMNLEKDRNNSSTTENNVVVNSYRQFNTSMEMLELNNGKGKMEENEKIPKDTQARRNLLSEGIGNTVNIGITLT